jgi:hypothetical protein
LEVELLLLPPWPLVTVPVEETDGLRDFVDLKDAYAGAGEPDVDRGLMAMGSTADEVMAGFGVEQTYK